MVATGDSHRPDRLALVRRPPPPRARQVPLRLRPDRQHERRVPGVRKFRGRLGREHMRRMRWLFAAILVALVGLDGLSSWRQFGYHFAADLSSGRDSYGFLWSAGTLNLVRIDAVEAGGFVPRNTFRWELPVGERDPAPQLVYSGNPGGTTIGFPTWPIAFTFGVLTLYAWRAHRRVLRAGVCRCCGYDLTGNQSGMCPECGTTTGQ